MLNKYDYYISDEEILKVEDVSLSYPSPDGSEKMILRDINISIKDIKRKDQPQTGQIVGFLGPSGRGKTQLFRILSGLKKPTTGSVLIHGKPVHPGDVGVVAQNYPLFMHHTVKNNLLLALRNKKMTKEEKLEKINDYLKRFKLDDKIDFYPASLSGGQRQRIAIIQQLLCSENFLLLDEPFSGLDINMIKEVSEVILEVANLNDYNTIILVSHDIPSTAAISDYLWFLGQETDKETGQLIPGSTIRYIDNLMEKGIAWNYPKIFDQVEFMEYNKNVRNIFQTL